MVVVVVVIEIVRLLQGKCDIDAMNKGKHSSLMLAMSEGRTAIVEYLVSKGIEDFFYLKFNCCESGCSGHTIDY